LWRIFNTDSRSGRAWNQFRTFGPTESRFDHHPQDPPARMHADYGILYATEAYVTAFAEFFQRTRMINRTRKQLRLVEFALQEPLILLDLTGSWMLKVGGGPQIATGDRAQARKWSRVFHPAFPEIDDVCYPASLNTAWRVYALYERAERAMPSAPILYAPLADPLIAPYLSVAESATHYDVV
jgi:hypothetical protein